MPELAEVEITRRKLIPLLRGRRILDFWTDWPRGLIAKRKAQSAKDMRRRVILDIARRGKVLFFKLSGQPERMLAIHLRMSGRLEVTNALKTANNQRWTHFVWRLSGGKKLGCIDPRKFGLVWYGSSDDFKRDSYLGRLGQDAHSRALTFEKFSKILDLSRGAIKPFLLRQDRFSGVGNIIADEALWRAKIHPQTPNDLLTAGKRRQLFQCIQATIRVMLSSGGTTLRNWGHPDGRIGGYQDRRRVYGRAGEPCPRCRTRLARLVIGGRGTTLCPRCQERETRV